MFYIPAIIIWAVGSAILVGLFFIFASGVDAVEGLSPNNSVGRMTRRSARETEQWTYNKFVPFALAFIFGGPVLIGFMALTDVFSVASVCNALVYIIGALVVLGIVVIPLIVFGLLVGSLFKSNSDKR